MSTARKTAARKPRKRTAKEVVKEVAEVADSTIEAKVTHAARGVIDDTDWALVEYENVHLLKEGVEYLHYGIWGSDGPGDSFVLVHAKDYPDPADAIVQGVVEWSYTEESTVKGRFKTEDREKIIRETIRRMREEGLT